MQGPEPKESEFSKDRAEGLETERGSSQAREQALRRDSRPKDTVLSAAHLGLRGRCTSLNATPRCRRFPGLHVLELACLRRDRRVVLVAAQRCLLVEGAAQDANDETGNAGGRGV